LLTISSHVPIGGRANATKEKSSANTITKRKVAILSSVLQKMLGIRESVSLGMMRTQLLSTWYNTSSINWLGLQSLLHPQQGSHRPSS
jgi:hypothetical protein